MHNYQGVIFDFNGTLFKDSHQHEQAWQQIAQKYMHRRITPMEFAQYVHGRSNQTILKYLFKRTLTNHELHHLASEKEKLYRSICLANPDSFHLVPGATVFFDNLVKHGIPMTIATSATIDNVTFYFKHFHLAQWFDIQRIVYNTGDMPGKPDPTIFVQALNRLYLEPSATVVFEDALSGIQAAKNAQIKTIIGLVSSDNQPILQNCQDLKYRITDFRSPILTQLFLN
ncbi:sugar phosphatase of HAD family protein [Agrilactobacillus composti DSM 18527 = JCM 14202]|uniref:Sugar phosphatase of HAD family protein n=1 Tax=Agrilactobacillus composti DSM 18527 = JCM 14202 TaxID=1423734 RepID=X0QJ47_9LACO|nr:HAD family phosphatase [Agrilactobacillus composti]KRM33029.1 sugar phosphatase of HAD family protein [Agrilactobacillus composti DSM 18527 = JCM 14202]GAF38625.1 beta-phosphoglucomutase [Agrilactobacillus composti DSM 18527 = JCM 14202]